MKKWNIFLKNHVISLCMWEQFQTKNLWRHKNTRKICPNESDLDPRPFQHFSRQRQTFVFPIFYFIFPPTPNARLAPNWPKSTPVRFHAESDWSVIKRVGGRFPIYRKSFYRKKSLQSALIDYFITVIYFHNDESVPQQIFWKIPSILFFRGKRFRSLIFLFPSWKIIIFLICGF